MTDEREVVERVAARAASLRRIGEDACARDLEVLLARVGELERERGEAFLLTLCDLVTEHVEFGYLSTKVRLELIERARRAASLVGKEGGSSVADSAASPNASGAGTAGETQRKSEWRDHLERMTRFAEEVIECQRSPHRGDWGVECPLCMGELAEAPDIGATVAARAFLSADAGAT